MTTHKSFFIKSVACDTLFRNYDRVCSAVAVALLAVILIFSNFGLVMLSAFLFNLLVLGLRRLHRNSRDPFVLLFLTFSILFIEFPVAMMALLYPEYYPTAGLSFDWPAPKESTVVFALGFLFLFYLGFFAAVAWVPIRLNGAILLPKSHDLPKILTISIVMLAFSFAYDNYLGASTTMALPGVWIELAKFLGYDFAIFALLFLVVNRSENNPAALPNRRHTLYYMAFILGFMALHTFNGSKGGILLLLFLAFLFPLAILGHQAGQRLLMPRMWIVLVAVVASPVIFVVAIAFRLIRMSGQSAQGDLSLSEAIVTAVSKDNFLSNDGLLLFVTISDRLSATFNRYVLIYWNFESVGFSDSVRALPGYIFESFMNLHLPGTPYPNSYYLSSMQFENILLGHSLISGDVADFQRSLNSQPYSIFGLAVLLVGFFGPFLLFALVVALRWLCVHRGFWCAFFSLMFFNSALSCYGIEAAFQVSLSMIATIFFVKTLAAALPGSHQPIRPVAHC